MPDETGDKAKYNKPRPAIPAEIRRAAEVEAGHACGVARCGEHTYLEAHHINGNREDNRIENVILLCDKHHKMAEAGTIDRKSLREYKELMRQYYNEALASRLGNLERAMAKMEKLPRMQVEPAHGVAPADSDLPVKQVSPRPPIIAFTLEQLALAKFERERNLYLDRQPHFTKGTISLRFDAVRQDDKLPKDLVVEVRWIRKRYLDGPAWVEQTDATVELYELITGRPAQGILLLIVPKDTMKELAELPLTAAALQESVRKPEVIIYTYSDLGFDPGPITAGLFTSNLSSQGESTD